MNVFNPFSFIFTINSYLYTIMKKLNFYENKIKKKSIWTLTLHMPSITIPKQLVLDELSMNESRFEYQLFNYGIELEDTIEIDNLKYYKLDISANRFDLLCKEGIVSALSYYCHGKTVNQPIQFINNSKKLLVQHVTDRPIVTAFILHKVLIGSLPSLIEYQETLHKNLGRNRKNMSMGLHQLEKINFPIFYGNGKKKDILFNPLRIGRIVTDVSMNSISLHECDEIFKLDKIMSKYITQSSDTPYFKDNSGLIFSYPPVLNCEETKLPLNNEKKIDNNTEFIDILVEITGNDKKKVEDAVAYIIGNFAAKIVEEIDIEHFNGSEKYALPTITNLINNELSYTFSKKQVEEFLNVHLTNDVIKYNLNKMMHSCHIENDKLVTKVHFVRRDILNLVDIIEDIAIAQTIETFEKMKIPFSTVGQELFSSMIEDKIREESAFAGFNEILNLTLLSEQENYLRFDENDDLESRIDNIDVQDDNFIRNAVKLQNPKSSEYQVVRTSIIPGLLKFIKNNAHHSLPLKLFETGDVCIVSGTSAQNRKFFAGVVAGSKDHLEDLLGFINQIFYKIGCICKLVEYSKSDQFSQDNLFIRKDIFLEKRGGKILSNDNLVIGMFGVLHPKILKNMAISHVMSVFELDLDLLTRILQNKKAS